MPMSLKPSVAEMVISWVPEMASVVLSPTSVPSLSRKKIRMAPDLPDAVIFMLGMSMAPRLTTSILSP